MEKLIHAYQCMCCGTHSLIDNVYCTVCREKKSLQEVNINGKGTVFSFTKIFVAEDRFQEETPYVVAVIESEEGLRLLGRILKEDFEKVSIGSNVELEKWKEEVPIFKVSKK